MIRKIISLFMMAGLLLLVLSGCKDPNRPSSKDPVTLTMWHNYGGDMQQSMDTLIDQFNSTVGKKQGIFINVTAISSSSELNESLNMIVNGDPGAPEMPDIFTGYPKIAVQFQEKNMLCNLDNYFSTKELSQYVDAFVEEGRLSGGGLYVFPLAKSTEILYLNQTLFDQFAAATGAKEDQLSDFEGIAKLSRQYYEWTDKQTPNVPNDGIVLDDEMYLHEQQPSARWTTPSGTQLPTSQSHHFANHFNITEQVSAQALASAALTGSRRVQVQLSKITLRNDKEDPFFGKPPAEVVVESTVKYAYVNAIDASEPTLDEVSMARRNAPVLSMNKGETKTPNLMIFDGPVFDGQTSVSLNVKLSETDFYPAGGVNENLLFAPAPLGAFSGDVPLAPGDYTVTTADAVFTLHVSIEKLY